VKSRVWVSCCSAVVLVTDIVFYDRFAVVQERLKEICSAIEFNRATAAQYYPSLPVLFLFISLYFLKFKRFCRMSGHEISSGLANFYHTANFYLTNVDAIVQRTIIQDCVVQEVDCCYFGILS